MKKNYFLILFFIFIFAFFHIRILEASDVKLNILWKSDRPFQYPLVLDADSDGNFEVVGGYTNYQAGKFYISILSAKTGEKLMDIANPADFLIEWSLPSLWNNPLRSEKEVLLCSNNDAEDSLFGVSAFNKKIDWTYKIDVEGAWAPPSVVSDDLTGDGNEEFIVLNWRGDCFAYDAFNNKFLWEYSTKFCFGRTIYSLATGDVNGDGVKEVIIPSEDGKLHCINGVTGQVVWIFDLKTNLEGFFRPVIGPLENDNTRNVYIASSYLFWARKESKANGNLFCLNGKNGEEKWKTILKGGCSTSPAIFEAGKELKITLGDDSGYVYLFDCNTGKEIWSYKTGGAIESSPVVGDINADFISDVIIGSNDGVLYGFDSKTGKVILKYLTGQRITSDPVIGDINQDGLIDILLSFSPKGSEKGFLCLLTTGNPGTLLWARGGGDLGSRNNYDYSLLYSASLNKGKVNIAKETLANDIKSIFPDNLEIPQLNKKDTISSLPQEKFSERINAKNAPKLIWETPLQENTHKLARIYYFSPIVCDIDNDKKAEVLAGSFDGRFYCLNAVTGSVKWIFQAGSGRLEESASVSDINNDGVLEVVFGSWDKYLYVISGKDGKIVWKFESDGYIINTPAVSDLTQDGGKEVVFGSTEGTLYCLNGKNGALIWKDKPPIKDSVVKGFEASVAIADLNNDGIKDVVAAPVGNYVYAYSGDTGKKLWEFDIGDREIRSTSPVIYGAKGKDPVIVCGDSDGEVFALYGSSGKVKWTVKVSDFTEHLSFVLADINSDQIPEIITSTMNGDIFCSNIENGTILWKKNYPDCRFYNQPVVFNSSKERTPYLIISTGQKGVMFIDSRSGEIVWNLLSDAQVISTPSLCDVNSNQKLDLAIYPYDGKNMLFLELENTGEILWPKAGGNLANTRFYSDVLDDIRLFSGFEKGNINISGVDINSHFNGYQNIEKGQYYYKIGKLKEAELFYKNAFGLFDTAGDTRGKLICELCLLEIELNRGDFKNIGNIELLLKKAEGYDFQEGQIYSLRLLAKYNYYTGNFQKAIYFAKNAYDLAIKTGFQGQGVEVPFELGNYYYMAGNMDLASDYFNIAKELPLDKDELSLISEISGDICYRRGNWKDAALFYKTAYDGFLESDNLNGIGNIFLKVSGLYKKNSDFSSRLFYAEQGAKIFEFLENKPQLASSYLEMASSLFNLGKIKESEALYQKAEEITNAYPDLMWQALYNKGLLLRSQKKNDEALDSYLKAISIIEEMRSFFTVSDLRTSFMENKLEVYEEIVDLLIEMQRFDEAFKYSEWARARTLIELLSSPKINLSSTLETPLIKKQKDILSRIRLISSNMKNNTENNPEIVRDEDFKDKTRELKDLQLEYGKLINELKVQDKQYCELVAVMPDINVMDIEKNLEKDSVMLEYFITDKNLYIWAISPEGVSLFKKSIEYPEIYKKVGLFMDDIKKKKMISENSLYNLLIAPAGEKIKGKKHLIIVPHKILNYLPFSALIDENGKYLIENYLISYLPSTASLKFFMEKYAPLKEDIVIYAIGNIGNSPLPFTITEAEKISNTIVKNQIIKENKLTRDSVIDSIYNWDMVHFSTHGILNSEAPLFSGLKVSDGIIDINDIFNLKLKAQMVTLSACNTALGKYSQGDEITGLMRAFLYAGAPSIVATLWSIDDKSTSFFMERFYLYIKTNSKAQALRFAQIDTMKEYKSPYYWACFILTGMWK